MADIVDNEVENEVIEEAEPKVANEQRKREIIIVDPDVEETTYELSYFSDEISTRTENREVRNIVADIKAVMRENNLVSLSAPAIGYRKRIFCIKFDGDIKAFINPIIANPKGLQLSRERCACIPGREYILPRNNEITVCYQKVTGQAKSEVMRGLAACVFQHEMNHLDGALISDFGELVPDNYDDFSDDEKEQFISNYLDSLDIKRQELEKEISENKELSDIKNSIEFMESIIKGETKLATKEDMEIK